MRPTDPYEYLPLFTYGTLRRGESNHHFLAGRYDRCLAGTLCGFRKTVAAHGYPVAVVEPGQQVVGELFDIQPESFRATLAACDLLEDLPPGNLVGPYYQRARVWIEIEAGAIIAWAYIDPDVRDLRTA
jgi:gamma-glutamylcyclotransferase (GGCT)/AIG2-like uncharacterized protein YtfP